jgi:hypothetical protein
LGEAGQPSRAAYDQDIALAVLQEQEEQLEELDQQDLGELDQEDLVDDQDPDLDGRTWMSRASPGRKHSYRRCIITANQTSARSPAG